MAVAKKSLKEKERRFVETGSVEEEAYMNKLESDLSDINADYVNYTAEHADIVDNQTSQLSYMQKVRHLMMFSACAAPLAHGISCDSVIQSIGMYAGMRLVDKDFKKDVQKGVSEMLSPYVEQKAAEKGENSKWAKWADKLKAAGNNGRMPLDPDTAALTQMGFLKKAYEDMRKPDANIDEISDTYEDAVKSLYKVAQNDGVSSDDINQSFRFMVGKMIERDPSNMKYFNETAYSGVSMSDYKPETVNIMGADGKVTETTKYVWSGEFQQEDGSEFTGQFTPRRPNTISSYGDFMSNFCSDILKDAVEKCPSESMKGVSDAITEQIKASQTESCVEINEKLSKGVINKQEAGRMRASVGSLEGFDMGASDLSDETKTNITKAMSESLQEYAKTDCWRSSKDAVYGDMMADDGLTQEDIANLQVNAKNAGIADAFVHIAHSAIDGAADKIREEYASRTKVGSSFKGRGHEFDDMFSKEDLEDDTQYV